MYEVTLRVYDLSMGLARGLSLSIIGTQIDLIPHTGVCAFGHEFFFSGGIQALPPHQVVEYFGMSPVQVVSLGHTHKSEFEFRTFLRSIAHRYTMESYDLFRHNCNNFSDEAARWLLGTGIPDAILSVPRTVLSTPAGAAIAHMMGSWQSGMNTRAAALGARGDPFAAMARAPLPTAATVAAAAALPAEAPVAASTELTTSPRPLVSAEIGNLTAVVARLLKVQDGFPSDATHRLTPDDVAVLQSLPTKLSSGAGALDSDMATCARVCSILGRVITEWFPREAAAAFPALCLLRLMVLSESAIPELTVPVHASLAVADAEAGPVVAAAEAGPSALAAVVNKCSASGMFGSAAANLMALSVLANVFKTGAGAAWATTEPVRSKLVDIALRETRLPAGDEKSKPEARQLGAALAYNICISLPPGSDSGNAPGGPANSTETGDATVLITDTSVQLLCGLLEEAQEEKDAETLRRRLLGAGHLIKREGEEAGALLATLGMDVPVRGIVADASRPTSLRALAQEVGALIRSNEGV